jgi:hypothetical protein
MNGKLLAIAVPALVASWLYVSTLAPGVVGLDSAELVTGAYTLGIVHPTGYPLYLLLGKLFASLPVGSIALRVNLMSAFLGVLSVAILGKLTYKITRSVVAAVVSALLLALGHTFWGMAIVAEVYTLHTLLLGLTLLSLFTWRDDPSPGRLFVVSIIFGLSLTNHVTSIFILPFIIWIVLQKVGIRRALRYLPLAIPGVLLGLTPYLYFPIRFAANPALNYVRTYYDVDLTTLSGMWWMVSGQAYRFFAFGYDFPHYLMELWKTLGLFVSNFTLVGFLLGVIGLVAGIRKRRSLALPILVLLAINVLFFSGYAVVDKATMFLPAFYLWALFIAIGIQVMMQKLRDLVVFSPVERRVAGGVYVIGLLAVLGLAGSTHRGWIDQSENYGPDVFARRVLATVPEDSVIIGRWSTAVILEYYQHVEGLRPDLVIFNRSRYEVANYYSQWKQGIPYEDAVDQILQAEQGLLKIIGEQRSLYDVEYDPYLARIYEYQPVGNLFKLIPRTDQVKDS